MKTTLVAIGLGAIASHLAWTGTARSETLLQVEGRSLQWVSSTPATAPVVTYSILSGPYSVPGNKSILSPSNCASMHAFSDILAGSSNLSEASARRELREAFAAWEQSANIVFVETHDPHTANIVIGAQDIPEGRAFANLSYHNRWGATPVEKALGNVASASPTIADLRAESGAVAGIEQAYICLNPKAPWKIGFDGNLTVYDLRYTFTHEIGHAIGLDHPYGEAALMAYRYDERIHTLQPSDIAAVQRLYGPARHDR